MASNTIEKVYYIPDKVKKGGQFYHEFGGVGDNLPNNIFSYITDDITIDLVVPMLLEKYGIKLQKLGGVIPKDNFRLEAFIAYKREDLEANKRMILKENLEYIRKYYRLLYRTKKIQENNINKTFQKTL